MATYIVSRTGWNKANQPSAYSPHTIPVCKVEADSPDDACDLAAERVTVYNGQYLSAELEEGIEKREAEIDARVKVL